MTSLYNVEQSSLEKTKAFEIAIRQKHEEDDSLLVPAYNRCLIRALILLLYIYVAYYDYIQWHC